MNRLAAEGSPYLRQHADNPVHWYPWGTEALAEAARLDRPLLISVGYSACHWCHVMAHESFEDAEVAAAMNATFVNVKVDREERPDVDAVYMDAVQAISGHGGWPMTVLAFHDGRPFYGGTYYPKPQFLALIARVAEVWHEQRDALANQAHELTEAIERTARLAAGAEVPPRQAVVAAAQALCEHADRRWGGFGQAPKFPQTMNLDLCLRVHLATGAAEPLEVATTSLDAMAAGGLYDHLGGGFARYSTDERWLVPHFEKMLYDQALLARVYLHAWQVTGEQRYRQVCEETIDYVRADLRVAGGYASARDADSEGVEGKYYVWTPAELVAVLGPADAATAAAWYGVSAGGNFEGASILHRPLGAPLARPAEIEAIRQQLLAARTERVAPGLDDKVLTEWNALMVATMAEAAGPLDRPDWLAEAEAVAGELLGRLRRADGRWLRSYQPVSGARHLAYAADYGALTDAFTRLAEATGRAGWVREAIAVADELHRLFWDDAAGGVFTTGHDAEALVVRQKDLLDNATPSANSLAAVAFARLGALTGEPRFTQWAAAVAQLTGRLAMSHPSAFGHLLAAVDLLAAGATEIVVVGDRPDLLAVARRVYLPNAVLAWGEPMPTALWEGRTEPAAYVCRHGACELPATSAEQLAAQLASAGRR